MKAGPVVSIFFCLTLAAYDLYAGVIPGRWEKVDSQLPGTGLVVRLETGETVDCFYQRAELDAFFVLAQSGVERRISKSDVMRVETAARTARSGRRGALIGAAAGAAPMGLLGAFLGHAISEHPGDTAQGVAIFAGIGAGIGALVGLAAGRFQKDIETLYVSSRGVSEKHKENRTTGR